MSCPSTERRRHITPSNSERHNHPLNQERGGTAMETEAKHTRQREQRNTNPSNPSLIRKTPVGNCLVDSYQFLLPRRRAECQKHTCFPLVSWLHKDQTSITRRRKSPSRSQYGCHRSSCEQVLKLPVDLLRLAHIHHTSASSCMYGGPKSTPSMEPQVELPSAPPSAFFPTDVQSCRRCRFRRTHTQIETTQRYPERTLKQRAVLEPC